MKTPHAVEYTQLAHAIPAIGIPEIVKSARRVKPLKRSNPQIKRMDTDFLAIAPRTLLPVRRGLGAGGSTGLQEANSWHLSEVFVMCPESGSMLKRHLIDDAVCQWEGQSRRA
jgi:hypothetical protein